MLHISIEIVWEFILCEHKLQKSTDENERKNNPTPFASNHRQTMLFSCHFPVIAQQMNNKQQTMQRKQPPIVVHQETALCSNRRLFASSLLSLRIVLRTTNQCNKPIKYVCLRRYFARTSGLRPSLSSSFVFTCSVGNAKITQYLCNLNKCFELTTSHSLSQLVNETGGAKPEELQSATPKINHCNFRNETENSIAGKL